MGFTSGFRAYAFGHCLDGHSAIFKNESPTLFTGKIGEGFNWKSGDIVTVRLDLKEGTLEFERKRVSLAIIKSVHRLEEDDGHWGGYRLAIDNVYCGNRIKLLSY